MWKLSAAKTAMQKKLKLGQSSAAHGDFKDQDLGVACLGRPVALGTLYDARHDRFITGTKLWSQASTQNMTRSQPNVKRTISILKNCSFSDKANLLKLSADLKLGFLCGNSDAEGSGRYLNDSKTSLNSLEITLAYRIVTRFDELHLEQDVEYPEQLTDSLATHVVTGIKFGAAVFLVFEKEREQLEEATKTEESLETMVSALKNYFDESSDAPPPKYDEGDDSIQGKIKCRYFGDFDVESQPSTLRDAFSCVSSFSSENAETPLIAYLTPLSALGGKAVMKKRKITDEQLNEAGDYLQTLNDLIEVARAQLRLLDSTPWHRQRAALSEFLKLLKILKTRYSEKLLKALPIAREHKKGCDKIAKLLARFRDKSPFAPEKLLKWISNRERECIALQSYSTRLKSVRVELLITAAEKQQFESSGDQKLLVELNFPELSSYLKDLNCYLNGIDNSSNECCAKTWIETSEQEKLCELVNELVSITERRNTASGLAVSVALISESVANHTDRIQICKKYRKGHQWCNLELPSAPKDLLCDLANSTMAKVSWSAAKCDFDPTVRYRVNIYRSDQEFRRLFESKITDSTNIEFCGLDSNSEFKVRVACVTYFGDSSESKGVKFKTLPLELCSEYARKFLCEQKPLKKQDGETFPGDIFLLKKRRLKLTESCQCPVDDCTCPESFDIGASKVSAAEHTGKYLLVVGETGTGKSTFINALANAFYGVEYKDPFRLRLIDEAKGQSAELDPLESRRAGRVNQAHSQTSKVTVYTLQPVDTMGGCNSCKSALDCPLTVIDTPGFGDTGGPEEDQKVIKKIARVLGEDSSLIPRMVGILHAIAFIVKASQNRLTVPQKYIFDLVLSLFGKDVERIISPILTFADSNEPQALAALREDKVPHEHFLTFNNVVLYSDNTDPRRNSNPSPEDRKLQFMLRSNQLDWERSMSSYDELFADLKKINETSLKNTRDVLRQRSTLENARERMLDKVQDCLNTMASIEQELSMVETLDAIIKDADMNKTRRVTVPKRVKKNTKPGRFAMWCKVCEHTCHNDCSRGPQDSQKKCRAISILGRCMICPKKCRWNDHESTDHYFENTMEEEIVSVAEIFEKYEVSVKDREAKASLINRLKEKLKKQGADLTYDIVTIHKCLETLEQLALRQYPLGIVQYIDNLISSQEMEMKPGWQNRIKYLAESRKSAEIIAQTRQGEDPFGNKILETLSRCESVTGEAKRCEAIEPV